MVCFFPNSGHFLLSFLLFIPIYIRTGRWGFTGELAVAGDVFEDGDEDAGLLVFALGAEVAPGGADVVWGEVGEQAAGLVVEGDPGGAQNRPMIGIERLERFLLVSLALKRDLCV